MHDALGHRGGVLVGRVIAALAADPTAKERAGQALTCWDLARHYGVKDVDGAQPHWDEHLDVAVEEILSSAEPSDDDLFFLRMRKPQIDFDESRAEQRTRIEAYLKSRLHAQGNS